MDRGRKELQYDGQIMERSYIMMHRSWKGVTAQWTEVERCYKERSYSTMDRSWKGVTARWTDHGKQLQHDGQIMERSYSMMDRCGRDSKSCAIDTNTNNTSQHKEGIARDALETQTQYITAQGTATNNTAQHKEQLC